MGNTKNNVEKVEGDVVDEHGFVEGSTLRTSGTTGINNWEDLPEPWKSYDFIFQEIENNDSDVKLFELVKVPEDGSFDDIKNNIYNEKSKDIFTEQHDAEYAVQWVYLSGRFDDSSPVGKNIGGDYNGNNGIVKSQLKDWRYEPGDLGQ